MENIFKINLQLFAEGDSAAAGAGEAAAEINAAEGGEKGEKTFSQAEVEDIISKRFAKLQRESEKRVEQARKDGMTEGEKLANMSAEERFKAQQEKAESDFKAREDALKQREAELTRKELRAQAVETLTGKGLPAGLAKYLDYTDADACNASIAEVAKDFGEMLKAEVDKRLAASSVVLTRSGSAANTAQAEETLAEKLARKRSAAAAEAAKAAENIPSKYL